MKAGAVAQSRCCWNNSRCSSSCGVRRRRRHLRRTPQCRAVDTTMPSRQAQHWALEAIVGHWAAEAVAIEKARSALDEARHRNLLRSLLIGEVSCVEADYGRAISAAMLAQEKAASLERP